MVTAYVLGFAPQSNLHNLAYLFSFLFFLSTDFYQPVLFICLFWWRVTKGKYTDVLDESTLLLSHIQQ